MTSATYYDLIDATFDELEEQLEVLQQDPDIATAEGVINVTFRNGVVFVFSRQPPTEQLWLATPGGGFHYEWDAEHEDWCDTKSGEFFRPFLVAQLAEHANVSFDWS